LSSFKEKKFDEGIVKYLPATPIVELSD